MAKARFTTTRSISYDDDFDLEPCLALLRGDPVEVEEDDELESNPRVATASVIDEDDEYGDIDDEYDDQPYQGEGEYDDEGEYEDDVG